MKNCFVLLIAIRLFLFYNSAYSQISFDWSRQLHTLDTIGASEVVVTGVDTAFNGDYVIYGTFNGSLDLDPGPGVSLITSPKEKKGFVAKYNQVNQLVFAKSFGGYGTSFSTTGIIISSSIDININGDIILSGWFSGQVDIDPGTGLDLLINRNSSIISDDKYAVFILVLDSAGNKKWVRSFNPRSNDTGIEENVSIDHNVMGEIYVAGIYGEATSGIDPFNSQYSTLQWKGFYIFRFDENGVPLNFKALNGDNASSLAGFKVGVSGNLYMLCGGQKISASGSTSSWTLRYDKSLIIKLDANLDLIKIVNIIDDDSFNSFTLDPDENIYFVGSFVNSVDFDAGAGSAILNSGLNAQTGKRTHDQYLCKYDSTLSFQFVNQISKTTVLRSHSIFVTLDNSYHPIVCASYEDTLRVDPWAGNVNYGSSGKNDIVSIHYNQAGTYIGSFSVGGTGDDLVKNIITLSNGKIIAVGAFDSSINFNPTGVSIIAAAGNAISGFVWLMDSSLNFEFACTVGNFQYYLEDVTVSCLELDSAGNIYIAGYFNRTFDFDPGIGVFNMTSAGSTDIFFAKYSSMGNLIFAKRIGDYSADYAVDIALDKSNNIYVTGYFWAAVDFDPDAGVSILTSQGLEDCFIAKYDAAGNFILAKSIEGASHSIPKRIFVDQQENIYLVGNFEGNIDCDPGPGTDIKNSYGKTDFFILKLDPTGILIYASSFGSTVFGAPLSDDDYISGAVLDENGTIFITGRFGGDLDIDPGPVTHNLHSTCGEGRFLAKFNTMGQLLFSYAFEKSGIFVEENYERVAVDSNGNLYMLVFRMCSTDIDVGSGVNIQYGSLLIKYDSLFNLVYVVDSMNLIFGNNPGNIKMLPIDNGGIAIFNDMYVHSNNGYSSSGMRIAEFDAMGTLVYKREIYSNEIASGSKVIKDKLMDAEVNSNGDILIVGSVFGSLDVDPGLNSQIISSQTGNTAFLCKYIHCNEVAADMPILALNPDTLCFSPGASVIANVIGGNLNDAKRWNWYRNVTEFTSELVDTGNSIVYVPVDNNNILYVRGEGECKVGSYNSVNLSCYTNQYDYRYSDSYNSGIIKIRIAGLVSAMPILSYQWLDCNNNFSPIVGQNTFELTISQSGSYCVVLTLQNGCVDTVPCFWTDASSPTSLTYTSSKHLVSVYPNPFKDRLTIDFDDLWTEAFQVDVYDLFGRIVKSDFTHQSNPFQLILTDLPSGLYLLNLHNKNESINIKVIKQQ